jgi:hypothetical protein
MVNLWLTFSALELLYAAQMNFQLAGKQDGAQLFKEVPTPTTALKMRHACKVKQENVGITSFTSNEGLSFVNVKLSKHQYQLMRSNVKQNADIYPSYYITEVKQHCYPNKQSFRVTDTPAAVYLQDLVDHTILHIAQAYEILLARVAGKNVQKIILVSKWGFDGSTGRSEYTQRFCSKYSYRDLSLTSLVPIQLFTSSSKEEKVVLWQI